MNHEKQPIPAAILFINCRIQDFIADMISGRKKYETRTKNMLRELTGKTVYIAETGRGRPIIRAIVTITEHLVITTAEEFERMRPDTCIRPGGPYDYTGGKKHLYKLDNVTEIEPFRPAESTRHGRVWMDYNGKESEA